MAEDDKKMLPSTTTKKAGSHPRRPLCALTTYSLNKLFLFLYAFMFLVVGTILFAVGIWAEIERRQFRYLDNHLPAPVALLIFVGLLIMVNALIGIIGTLREHVTLLKLFLAFTVVAFLLQVVVGVLGFVFREKIPALARDQLIFGIEVYTDSDSIQWGIDKMQQSFQCCGLESYTDYENNANYRCGSNQPQDCSVPQSCCKPKDGTVKADCGKAVRYNFTESEMGQMIYTDGCIREFRIWLVYHLDVVGAIALGFAIPQLLGMLLAYFFIRRVVEMRVWYRVNNY